MGDTDAARIARLEAKMANVEQSLEMIHGEQLKHGDALTRLLVRDGAVQSFTTGRAEWERRLEGAIDHIDRELTAVREYVSNAKGAVRVLILGAALIGGIISFLGVELIQHIQNDRITTESDVRTLIPLK